MPYKALFKLVIPHTCSDSSICWRLDWHFSPCLCGVPRCFRSRVAGTILRCHLQQASFNLAPQNAGKSWNTPEVHSKHHHRQLIVASTQYNQIVCDRVIDLTQPQREHLVHCQSSDMIWIQRLNQRMAVAHCGQGADSEHTCNINDTSARTPNTLLKIPAISKRPHASGNTAHGLSCLEKCPLLLWTMLQAPCMIRN